MHLENQIKRVARKAKQENKNQGETTRLKWPAEDFNLINGPGKAKEQVDV